ncbi:MAG: hypothetical protein R2838_06045 [Caldilineaceae bacterium]
MTKQILILMSDTGGGHRSSADALSAGFTRHAGTAVNVRSSTCCARSPALPVSSNSRRLPVSRQPHAAALASLLARPGTGSPGDIHD